MMPGKYTDWCSVELYRSDAIEAATDLLYGDEVIQQIKEAKTVAEIERIMVAARKRRK